MCVRCMVANFEEARSPAKPVDRGMRRAKATAASKKVTTRCAVMETGVGKGVGRGREDTPVAAYRTL